MPATKRGIYHNLKESTYAVSNSEIAFFFSSRIYLRKYLAEYKENRVKFLERIERNKTPIPLNLSILADLTLYRQIEKRGFRACVKGVEIGCEDLHQFALRKMTVKSTPDWYEMPVEKLIEHKRITGLI